MKSSRTKHKILPPSKFGLIQITRQRVRPERVIKTKEDDPNSSNREVEAPILLIDKIESDLDKLMKKNNNNGVALHVHTFIASHLTKGIKSIQFEWFLKYKKWIKIIPRDAFPYLKYQFYNKDDKLIR
jgi:ribonuclease G